MTAATLAVRTGGPAGANAVLGTLIFLAAEAMLFAGLTSAFLVLRAHATVWPAVDAARLAQAVTVGNLLLLLASGRTAARARRSARAGDAAGSGRWLGVTIAAGAVFLAVQGTEWVGLVRHGAASGAGLQAGLFCTLIAMHGLHVLGGVGALAAVWRRARGGRPTPAAVTAAVLYWWFVVAVWPVLWLLIYGT